MGLMVVIAGPGVAAQTLDVGGRRCAVPNPTLSEVVESIRVVEAQKRLHPLGAALRAAADPVTIPVAFHVVTTGESVAEGNIPDAWLEAQIDTLNSTFAVAGYRFVLSVVERVQNESWYDGLLINSDEEEEMMEALALDPSRYLNLYTADLGRDYLGWATVPDTRSETDPLTGVVLLDQSLPGGDAVPYNLGHTGTHEVGHWMGLFHTFQGGCSAPNDGVADTPQEQSGADGCPENRDSCPNDPGLDPIHNYMDYSSDACMTGFTSGQNERVQAMVRQFRPTLTAGGIVVANVARTAFDDVPLEATSTAPLAVTNLRSAPVTITGASSSNAAFAVSGLPLTVAAGEAAALTVSFDPAGAGPASTVLTLATDAGSLTVSVVGTAGQLPSLAVETTTVLAETVEEGTVTAPVAFVNEGAGALTYAVETVSLPSWIAEVAPSAGTLPPGEAGRLDVRLSAAGLEAAAYEAVLILTTNDPEATQVEIPVSLLVRERPEARLDGRPDVELIENDAASSTVTLANDGAGILVFEVDAASLPAGIADVSPMSGAVASGSEIDLAVSFASSGLTVGTYETAFRIQTNDPFASVVDVPVSFTVRARPRALVIRPIYPNPGRRVVTIPLEVPVEMDARVEVFDARGRLVATLLDGRLADGYPSLSWDASAAPAGVYVIRAQTSTLVAVEAVVIAR